MIGGVRAAKRFAKVVGQGGLGGASYQGLRLLSTLYRNWVGQGWLEG